MRGPYIRLHHSLSSSLEWYEPNMSEQTKEIFIPVWIFTKIEDRLPKTRFTSVSDYVTYVLTQVVTEQHDKERTFTPEDEEKVKERLRALGYI